MDIKKFNNLAGAINHKFPNKSIFWEVHQTHEGVFLIAWDEKGMGQIKPTEKIMLSWVTEYETGPLLDLHRAVKITELSQFIWSEAKLKTDTRNLSALKIEGWQRKYEIAKGWDEGGRTKVGDLAIKEAEFRDESASELILLWLIKGNNYIRMVEDLTLYEAKQLKKIRDANTVKKIEAIKIPDVLD